MEMNSVGQSLLRILYQAKTLVEILQRHSEIAGSRICVTILNGEARTEMSYSDIHARAHRVASHLTKHTKQGDRVLIVMPTVPEFIDYFFGCMLSGRIPVPLPIESSNSRFSRIKSVISDCTPSIVVFANDRDYEKMKTSIGNKNVLIANQIEWELLENVLLPEISPKQVAFIQYTSGSTSDPKGVVLTHENLVENIRMIQQGMNITPEERVVSWLPIHHDMGLIGMLLTLFSCGSSTFIFPYQEFSRDPLSWLKMISQERATLTGAPTFAFGLVIKALTKIGTLDFDLSSLRMIYCGSERISAEIIFRFYSALERWRLSPSTFFPCYGLAEASLYVSGSFKDPPTLAAEESSYLSCGLLASGLSVRVMNEESELLPPGEVGEILLQGSSISAGYWRNLTGQIQGGVLSLETLPWLRTGDLGFVMAGEIHIVGRLKDTIKIRGRNIYPDDIEFEIEKLEDWFPSNGTVAVSSHSKTTLAEGITIIAEIQRSRRRDNLVQLFPLVQKVLSEQDLRCDRLVVLPPLSLPKTSSGKKQRQKTALLLKQGLLTPLFDSSPVPTNQEGSTSPTSLKPDRTDTHPLSLEIARLSSYLASINFLLADERRTLPADFLLKMKEFQLLSLLIPKNLGGSGLNNCEFAQVGETLGELDLSVGSLLGNHNTIGVLPILFSSTLKDKNEVLHQIASAGSIAAFAMTEPGAGSNPRMIATTVIQNEGKMTLSGEKIWIGNAPFASFITVFAKEKDAQGKDLGISAFLLRKGRHGFEVGEEQLTLGLKAMPQTRLIFDSIALTDADRLSGPGQGLPLAYRTMEYARFGLASIAVGAMKRARQIALTYAEKRQIWTGILIKNTFFQSKMAEIGVRIDALEALVKLSAQYLDQGNQLPQVLSLICKILAGEWLWQSVDSCLQFTGGRGYTENFGLARILRDARVIRIFEGPTESIAYQLGAICLRPKATNATSRGTLDSLCEELAHSLQGFKNLSPLDDASPILTGLYAAEFVALTHTLQTKASSAPVTDLIQQMIQSSKSRLEEGTVFSILSRALNLNSPLVSESRIRPPARALFDVWDGKDKAFEKAPIATSQQSNAPAADLDHLPKATQATPAEELRSWLKINTKISQIDDSRPLSEYGVDSLLAYELICFVEDQFNCKLPESLIAERPSINQLVDMICGNAGSSEPEVGIAG